MAAYYALRSLANYVSKLFFRDIYIFHQENIPEQGATIIYGNHNNMFVDGLLLYGLVPRPIRFIAAAKHVRNSFAGPFIPMAKVIPIQRKQDLIKQGKGVIISAKNKVIIGYETQFTKLQVGSTIYINNGPQLRVSQIFSDIQMRTDSKNCIDQQGHLPYNVAPKIQYSNLYSEVWKGLNEGDCIGIFPQGGSHDHLQLSPFKAGICIMALGAMEKYGIPVSIVPCGFNYYNPQNFRSKVILEFGPSYKVPIELVELYKRDQKQAISILLNTLQSMLKNVTTSMKNFTELSTMFLCRQLYTVNSKKQLTIKQKLQLNRRFARAFDILANKPQNKQFYQQILQFKAMAKYYRIPISKQIIGGHFLVDLYRFGFYFGKTVFRLVFAIPGLILLGPTAKLISILSERQRLNQRQRCLKKKQYNQYGYDIVGSYKIKISFILFPITCAINSTLLYFGLRKYLNFDHKKSLKYASLFAACMPFLASFMVRSYDLIGRSLIKLKFLFIRLFRRSLYSKFNQKKKKLSKQILKIIDQQGNQVIDNIQFNRIIAKNQLQFSQSLQKSIQSV